jgi:hypothetical protein
MTHRKQQARDWWPAAVGALGTGTAIVAGLNATSATQPPQNQHAGDPWSPGDGHQSSPLRSRRNLGGPLGVAS